MPERFDSKAVQCSCQLFRRLLVAYPRAHREEYGAAILQLFRDQCRDAWASNRARGLIGFWLRALADLLKTSILEHLSNVNRRKSMIHSFRPSSKLLFVFCAVFAAVFLVALGGSILITLLVPKTYRSTARVLVRYVAAQPQSTNQLLQAEFEIIQSHAVLGKASEALGLSQRWGKIYNNGQPIDETSVEAMLRSRLELRPIRNTDVIEIRAFAESPDDAAKLANGLAEAYRGFREEQLAPYATASVASRVAIIQSATREPKAVRPNIPLNIVAGMMIGMVMGAFCGVGAAGLMWFVGRRFGKTARPGRPASSNLPA